MKKNRRKNTATNAIDPATTTSKDWGFIPIPGKGGGSTNCVIPDAIFKRELAEYLKGGAVDA